MEKVIKLIKIMRSIKTMMIVMLTAMTMMKVMMTPIYFSLLLLSPDTFTFRKTFFNPCRYTVSPQDRALAPNTVWHRLHTVWILHQDAVLSSPGS